MKAARQLFDNTEITEIINNKLNTIRKLNLEKGLIYLQNTESELYTVLPREEIKTVMLKVEKKKNITSIIETIKEDLQYILNVKEDIISMAFEIKTYNNIFYVKRKY